jgi:trehalose/maltose hydrolase-like predicted phosphorylase
MLPGLLVLHPDHASAINNYRSRLLPQALENAKQNNASGALYPWTSARFGNCTGTGPCADYQYHLNTDIALVNWHQFLTTGNKRWLEKQGWPIIKGVAEMWVSKVRVSNETGDDGLLPGMYVVRNMTDPVRGSFSTLILYVGD